MTAEITRLLVANRGEIARRIFRTARSMGIKTVAVFADGDTGSPFVADADNAVALEGRTATDSYLDASKVLAAARTAGADAIHPGYGFLSENADFARAVVDAGLVWVGPPPEAIAAMGDKLEAKKLMTAAGIPTLPSIPIIEGMDLAPAADEIGYPVLVKAAAGGGGKGMRVVESPDRLTDAVDGAMREALSAFGDARVFLEKYLPAPRHVEIQVLGDKHGNLIHCFERECSIQRRHQKIVEEAPSPAVDDELRTRMGTTACEAVQAIGYHSAGTVEFLLDDVTGEFYFLEVNTRLQVEHPVTEEITGLDLVRQMIRVAEGHPLDVTQDDLRIDGHAIEVRLYAEDPANDFLPAIGEVLAWSPSAEPAARFDSGIETGSITGVDFDPMLAKVIVHATTRHEAARRLALVLQRLLIAGITTNRDFLVSTLRTPEFLAGETRTDFLDTVAPLPRYEPNDAELARLLVAGVLCRRAAHHATALQLAFMRAGYRNSVMPAQELGFLDGERELNVAYRSRRDGSVDVWIDGDGPISSRLVEPCEASPTGSSATTTAVTIDTDGLRSTVTVVEAAGRWHLHGAAGALDLVEIPRFTVVGGVGIVGGQAAPMPGTVTVVAVAVDDVVEVGQALVVMEAMKMEHTISAPDRAVVTEIRCAVGDQVDNGQVLVVLEPLM